MMNFSHWTIGCITLVLAGCGNMPTPSSKVVVPNYSTAQYEHLDCMQLKKKIGELNILDQEFTMAQEKRISDSQGHAAYYGWGSGDGMDTIELSKIRGKKKAIKSVYTKKNCNSTQ